MSWTTRHPSRPIGKSSNVVPAAGEHNTCGTVKRHPATHLKCGPCSCLGSSQGVASPPLPNGCARQLHGPKLHRDNRRDSIKYTCSQATARTTTRRVPWPSPLGLPREARGAYVVNGVLDEVLQEVPRPTASISEEDVSLRSQISWTYVNEQKREEVLDQEIEMDLAIQEHLFPKGGEVSHSQHCTVSGPSAQWYVTSQMSIQWYGSQSHSVPRLTR